MTPPRDELATYIEGHWCCQYRYPGPLSDAPLVHTTLGRPSI